ncbi:hypothetical protein NDI56_03805 [Haloarcula sp. S1CR25-12]|uniref:Uncharacterized protein n=1 Tax=Haloarcula saliterrae TaxID=2950534 RepID=A0ABU2F9L1_9EURY|nr:hypothetical protein [Haloarcula sp. S1CR25-12]MDS0258535.1 hypothetical protein [Haloarcula sp. S1CR25-12]
MSSAQATDRLTCQTVGCDTHCPELGDGSVQRDGKMRCAGCWDHYRQHGEWPGESRTLGTYDVRDYSTLTLVIGSEVTDYLAADGADRLHIRERQGRYELVGGDSDEWPDYAISRTTQLGKPAVDLLGLAAGDEVQARTDGGVVVLDPIGDAADDSHRVGDPIDEDDVQEEADGDPDESDGDDELPVGLTADDVREAVETADGTQKTGHSYLGDVAKALNVRPARARVFCHAVGVYDEVTDASGPKGGDD